MKEEQSEDLNHKLQDMKWFILNMALPRLDHSSLVTTENECRPTETLDNITTEQLCCYVTSSELQCQNINVITVQQGS